MLRAIIIFLAGSLIPAAALAHAVERGLVQLLPTHLYLFGGGTAVLLTVAIMFLVPARRGAAVRPEPEKVLPSDTLSRSVQTLAFLMFLALVLSGLFGPRNPLANLAPLTVWTLFWIGLVGVTALSGSLWPWLNPWSAPCALIGREKVCSTPVRFGYWPAIFGLALFLWFDLAWPAPRDPYHVAVILVLYWSVHFVAQMILGAGWRSRSETFTVLFDLVGRISPFSREGLNSRKALPLSGWLFVTLAISGITADGLMASFWWFELMGANPLDPPGRSDTVLQSTMGLVAAWLLFSLAFSGSVWLGAKIGGSEGVLPEALGRLAFSLLPIAVGYHLSHFLVHFLIHGQYALMAFSDPLGTGRDWLNLGPHFVSTSFTKNLVDMALIWKIQVGLIVAAHLAGVLIAHRVAQDLFGARAALAGLPLGGLMVAMTVLGLWLLSTPTAG